VRIFHLSDIHFGLEDLEALAWARDCIAREQPDAVVISGDLTMRARHREYEAAIAWIAALDAPVTVSIGNHDMPYFNLVERFVSPYRRYRAIHSMIEQPVDLPGLVIVPLKTTARAQWRLNWSKGWITGAALAETLAQIDALPPGTRVMVSAHHPLVETGTRGTALTRGGSRALAELARRKVLAVLSGHVHDPFDLIEETAAGPVRMIGAGTLSQRLRSTPASFNDITVTETRLCVETRNMARLATPDIQIDDIPDDAEPPLIEEQRS
jgi:3',5'-cyclic AMP phosphodiesterase CpdA